MLPDKIAAQYAARWKQSAHPPHTDVLAVGDDANLALLRNLSRNGGFLESVLSTEPFDLHLSSFLIEAHARVLSRGSRWLLRRSGSTKLVYPLDDAVYPGSMAQWVGEYTPGKSQLKVVVQGLREGSKFEARSFSGDGDIGSHPSALAETVGAGAGECAAGAD